LVFFVMVLDRKDYLFFYSRNMHRQTMKPAPIDQ
jgi:hypothetical protein